MSPTDVTTRTGGTVSREGAKTRSCHAEARRRRVENRFELRPVDPSSSPFASSRLRVPPSRVSVSPRDQSVDTSRTTVSTSRSCSAVTSIRSPRRNPSLCSHTPDMRMYVTTSSEWVGRSAPRPDGISVRSTPPSGLLASRRENTAKKVIRRISNNAGSQPSDYR